MTELEEACDDALTRMYEEAKPPLDFMEVKANPEQVDEKWYQQHYLPSKRQEEIVDEVADEYELSRRKKVSLSWEAILNLGPAGSEEAWTGGDGDD